MGCSESRHVGTINDGEAIKWIHNGLVHREDGPAVVSKNGDLEWYVNGLRHREDGPAIMRINGRKEWWLNGKRSRKPSSYSFSSDENEDEDENDNPSIIDECGVKRWYKPGTNTLHRDNGPAIEGPDCKMWLKNGLFHREDGPALTYRIGFTTTSSGVEIFRQCKIYAHHYFTGTENRNMIVECWLINGSAHRTGGPALYSDDSMNQRWFVNGLLHRIDGPAVIKGENWSYYIEGIYLDKGSFDILKK